MRGIITRSAGEDISAMAVAVSGKQKIKTPRVVGEITGGIFMTYEHEGKSEKNKMKENTLDVILFRIFHICL